MLSLQPKKYLLGLSHLTLLALFLGTSPQNANAFAGRKINPQDPCDQPHELPIVTHWRNNSLAADSLEVPPGFDFGASDQFTRVAPSRFYGHYQAGACYSVVSREIVPNFNQYPGSNFSIMKISDSTAIQFAHASCVRTGVPVRFFRPDLQDRIEERLTVNPGYTQILHGMIIADSMVTLILPPNWNPQAQTYPIVASSLYDLNQHIFSNTGEFAVDTVAQASTQGRTGVIGMIWNGGGAIASRSANALSRSQFNQIIDVVAKRFGGDRNTVLTYGASRGGIAAIEAASNPDPHQYRVRFVYAAVPGVKLGTHENLSPLTLPGLMGNFDYTTALADAWRPGWKYPHCNLQSQELWDLSGPEALLYIHTGETDPAVVDQEHSPISDRFVQALKEAGTELYIESSTHDFIIPFAHEAEYLRKLRAAGIPLETTYLIRSGHQPPVPITWFKERIWPAIEKIVTPGHSHDPLVKNGETHYFRINRETRLLESFTPKEGIVPFTLEVPRLVYPDMKQEIIVSGDPGTQYEITRRLQDHSAEILSGTLPEAGHLILNLGTLSLKSPRPALQLGQIQYERIRIKRTDHEWKEIDPSETTSMDRTPLFTQFVAELPIKSGMEMTNIVSFERRVPGTSAVSWGTSEW